MGKAFSGVIDCLFSLFLNFTGVFGTALSSWLLEQGFELKIPENVFDVLDEITYGIGYIFPLYGLLPIVTFWLIFYGVKITITVFKFIMGGIVKS